MSNTFLDWRTRPGRPERAPLLGSIGIAAALVVGAVLLARADPPPAPEAPPAKPAAPATPAAKEGPPATPAAKPSETSKATPQHFEPTEKTRADFEVSFPVDI